MKTVTRIITAQITQIRKVNANESQLLLKGKPYSEECIREELQDMFCADDVTVSIQDFIMDMEEGEENED